MAAVREKRRTWWRRKMWRIWWRILDLRRRIGRFHWCLLHCKHSTRRQLAATLQQGEVVSGQSGVLGRPVQSPVEVRGGGGEPGARLAARDARERLRRQKNARQIFAQSTVGFPPGVPGPPVLCLVALDLEVEVEAWCKRRSMEALTVLQIGNTRKPVWRKTVQWTVPGPLGADGPTVQPPVDLATGHVVEPALRLPPKMEVCPAMDQTTRAPSAQSAWQGCVRLWTGVGPSGHLGPHALHHVDQGKGKGRGLAPGVSPYAHHLYQHCNVLHNSPNTKIQSLPIMLPPSKDGLLYCVGSQASARGWRS